MGTFESSFVSFARVQRIFRRVFPKTRHLRQQGYGCVVRLRSVLLACARGCVHLGIFAFSATTRSGMWKPKLSRRADSYIAVSSQWPAAMLHAAVRPWSLWHLVFSKLYAPRKVGDVTTGDLAISEDTTTTVMTTTTNLLQIPFNTSNIFGSLSWQLISPFFLNVQ